MAPGLSWGCSHLKARLGLRTLLPGSLCGCWQTLEIHKISWVGICSGLLHTMATSYPQVSHTGHSKREFPKWTLQSFYNLTSEVLSHHSCCIRVGRSKSTVSAPARGHERQKAGTIGGHLRGCLSHWLGVWILELKR